MRKLLLICMLVPLFGMGQMKNVVNFFRIFPKPDKASQLEKALVSHAQKYHTGNWKWKVFEIQTGPDAGGFHVLEGPLSWGEFDGRGDLGAAHTADWNNVVSPLTTGMGTQGFGSFLEEMSTVPATGAIDKIIVNHIYPKPGMVKGVMEMIAKMKKVWEAGNESVAVYELSFSGEPQIVIVDRLKDGLKELDDNYRKPFPERYNAEYGAGAWDEFLKSYANNVARRWSELLVFRPDLSSK